MLISPLRVAALLSMLVPTLQAQAPVTYEVRLANRAHHEADITVTFREVPAGTLELRMSRSSPGRYALHEFAKNVYGVRAEDSRGRALPVTLVNPHQWNVTGHDGTVRVRYILFADRADGTYSGIDLTHAHLNAPATWLWARGMHARAAEVRFHDLPAGWQVATQLVRSADGSAWRARDFQYLMDSPIEVGPLVFRTWTLSAAGRTDTIRLAIHHAGTDAEVDAYVAQIQPVVEEQRAVFGELPAFDYGVYTFLADYLPHVAGDGMEHRNSTILTSTGSLARSALGLLGTVSHEFFHAWNVERIRPASLEPFDFEEANMSGELWLAEGFTSYYGPLTIHRAGITDESQYVRALGGTVNAVLNAPGRRFFGPRGMSEQAPFVDAATSVDPQNKPNTFLSYYTYGAGIGLALDLTLRQRYPGTTLDHFMRELWVRHGKPEMPYTPADLQSALARVAGDAGFAAEFFRRFIDGSEAPDYATLLAQAGIQVRKVRAGMAWITDAGFRAEEGRVVVANGTLAGTPLYVAGLDKDDVVRLLAGEPIGSPDDIERILAARRPGDVLPIAWTSRGVEREGSLTLGESPRVETVRYEDAGLGVTEAMRRFRQAWLGRKR